MGRRFDNEEAQHSYCSRNCSVKKAKPFYEKRRLHEKLLETQQATLQSVEGELHVARERVRALQAPLVQKDAGSPVPLGRMQSIRSFDELSLHSFEMPGAQPAEDEFHDCMSSDGAASDRSAG